MSDKARTQALREAGMVKAQEFSYGRRAAKVLDRIAFS
jgi:hypothetical protein